MKTPRLVAFDLDGTLTQSKQRMTPQMGDLLSKLVAKMPVAIVSGAGWIQFEDQILPALTHEAALSQLYLFPDNAAQCFVFRAGSWHPQYDHAFSSHEKQKILNAIQEALEESGFEQPLQLWGPQIEDRGAEITFSALGQHAPLEEKKRFDPTREKRRPLYEALLRRLPDFSVGLNAATSIDITRLGITKAYGIGKLAELTGIPISEMLYIGDALEEGGNDAAVLDTGIATHPVFGPNETERVIEALLQ